ncbi:hypothetical protein BpHYR1_041073 [Brachionus plicatilis]|uniref:Uncharacterized protein n=1 Tax=Brachionus plicatilis TaxID=10195 RepID=A0A3M7Q2K1_BRAPC|nr:hypothetical protein BpHYR1_041073 [Brachionus plicatilis]
MNLIKQKIELLLSISNTINLTKSKESDQITLDDEILNDVESFPLQKVLRESSQGNPKFKTNKLNFLFTSIFSFTK